LFDNYQEWASEPQVIKFKLAKWIASPILFDTSQSTYLDTNVTEVGVLNTAGIEVEISNLADNLHSKDYFYRMYTYSGDLLHAKIWDNAQNKLTKDGCSSSVYEVTTQICADIADPST